VLTPKAAARELLVSTSALTNAPPVNLGMICDWLSVEVYTMPCDAFGAALSPAGGHILANSRLPPGRFRFSVAHELGHFLLGHEPARFVGARSRRDERQADLFAAELLLPEEVLRADCAGRALTPPVLAALARRYRVSVQALGIRLKGLKLA
jgi:Zn-dependent peptidase ImmA (M78 family)